MNRTLTPIQLGLLGFLRDFHGRHGWMPTRSEISENFGWKSTNAAEEHLQRLRTKGFIEMTRGTARSLRLTEEGRAALGHSASAFLAGQAALTAAPGMIALPVVDMAKVNWLARRSHA